MISSAMLLTTREEIVYHRVDQRADHDNDEHPDQQVSLIGCRDQIHQRPWIAQAYAACHHGVTANADSEHASDHVPINMQRGISYLNNVGRIKSYSGQAKFC